MKTFDEKWTAWLDDQLSGRERAEFEASLPDRAAAEAERAAAKKLGALLRRELGAHDLANEEFFSHQLRDVGDASDVRVPVLLREAEALREVRADDVAVEVVDNEAAPFELRLDVVRDRRLACARKAREPEDEPAHVCNPHSVRSVPAQRPSRPLPGTVECVSPIES